MNDAYVRRETCRLCGGAALATVMELTPTPPANAFVTAEATTSPQATYPLDLNLCEGCGHVQLGVVVDPAVLFRDYVYVSGTSPTFVRHFERYAAALADRAGGLSEKLAIDIGSNDGTLLGFFQEQGARALGIDPAVEIAKAANAAGRETLAGFFTPDLARSIAAERGRAAVITANNVYAHADDLSAFTHGVRDLLADDGMFVFEVSYLADVIEKSLFDTIYHEHLSYHAVAPLTRFFGAHGLTLFHVERIDTHGGSLRCFVQHADGPYSTDPSVAAAVAREDAAGLQRAATFLAFAARVGGIKADLTRTLRSLKSSGARIAGYGAPAKATTLMYHFGFGTDVLDFIVDDSPLKQGLFSPGLHVPVLPSDQIAARGIDTVVILAWNFADAIKERLAAFREAGGTVLVPLPEVTLS